MNLSTGLMQLHATLKSARERWDEVKLHWNDSVERDFDENHWTPLEAHVIATLEAMDRLGVAITQAQRETR